MAIFVQTKRSDLTTDGNKFNHVQLNGWYKEISHSTSMYKKDYDVVIALITNREYNNPSTMVRGRTDAYGPEVMEPGESEPESELEESEPEETEPVDLD
ncbi:hypothetical protein BGZ76_007152, partial [Entomortierella beljakovae]